MADEHKCPRCGGAISHAMSFHTYGDEHFELPFTHQQCMSNACGLPCRFWPEWQAMKDEIARLRNTPKESKS